MYKETIIPASNPQLAALQASFANEFNDEPVELLDPVVKAKKPARAKALVIKDFLTAETAIELEMNLPTVQINVSDVGLYHKTPEQLVAKIQQQAGSFVFNVSTLKGRDACRSHAANIIRCITPALNASKSIAADAKKVQEADLFFRKAFESGVREIADQVRNPLTEWEAEQDRLESDRLKLEAEAIEQQRLADQFKADWEAALVDNELFDFRKAKAERDAIEQAELKAKQQADHERELQEQAAEKERERIAAEQRQREAEQAREVERIETERLAAIARAEKAELDKIEFEAKAEREKLANEQRVEQAKQAAERDAKAREQAAIDNERKRVELEANRQKEEQAKIDAEEKKKSADMTHRGTVNNAIYLKLAALGVNDELAKSIIRAAVRRELGAMVVNY